MKVRFRLQLLVEIDIEGIGGGLQTAKQCQF